MSRDRTFFVDSAALGATEFEGFARVAARLKKHARVDVNVGSLSAKSDHDIPEGGSPWHEYGATLPTLTKLFPDDDLAPHVPAAYAAANRALLESRVEILRKLELGAGYHCAEPFFMHERTFERYPHLRGPRVDHPRRSRAVAFSPCVDRPEVQEMYSRMVAELVKRAPQLGMISIHTNDSGAGMCWNDNLYSGPNGPVFCRNIDTGQRIRSFANAIYRGAGRRVGIHMRGTFTPHEMRAATRDLDESMILELHRGGPQTARIGTFGDNPVMGAVDPLAILRTLERWRDSALRMVSVRFFMNYFRGPDHVSAADKVVEVVDRFLSAPRYGAVGRLTVLRDLCGQWVGEREADALLEALVEWHEALTIREVALPQFNCNYSGVSMRLITRPLVVMPDRLSPEEEGYFLPYVFNPSEAEARMDYLDYHGMRLGTAEVSVGLSFPRVASADQVISRVSAAAERLERLEAAGPNGDFFRDMGGSLRIYASILRSIHNFYMMQILRDRNAQQLAGPPVVHPKVFTRTGDPDNLRFIECMRDELDNAAGLIDLLTNGGALKQVWRAPTPEQEDTFLLGPDLVEQLRKKISIMRRHWGDMESVIAPRFG